MTRHTPRASARHPALPAAWSWSELTDVARVYAGSAAPQGADMFDSAGPPFVRVSDLSHYGRTASLIEVRDHLSKKALSKGGLVLGKQGTIVFPKSGAAIVGNNRAILGMDAYVVSHLMCVEPRANVTSEWLFYWLCQVDMMGVADNASYPSLKQSRVARLRLPLPPLSEQKRIAARLREQFGIVERATTASSVAIDAAGAVLPRLLGEMYTDRVLPDAPEFPLGELLDLRKDVVHPYDNPHGAAQFVGLEHIESGTGRQIGSVAVQMEALTGRKPRFYKGDIVYGYLRPYLNKVWLADSDGLCSVDQYVYRVNTKLIRPQFVAWFMRSPLFLRRAPISGSPGQLPRIRTDEVAQVRLAVPSLRDQDQALARLERQITATHTLRDALSASLTSLTNMSNALLREAFAGAR